MEQENAYKTAYEGLVEVIEASNYFESPNLIGLIRTNDKYIKEFSDLQVRENELIEVEKSEQETKELDPFEMIAQKYEG